MIRFRYEGGGWKVSAAVRALGMQVEAAWPDRQLTDGTLAGGSHAVWPTSDHGRDPYGWVRAIDIGQHDDAALDDLLDQLRLAHDMRLRYAIADRQMFSNYPRNGVPAWTWRPYTGSNPHSSHAHISMERLAVVDVDGRPWDVTFSGAKEHDMAFLPVQYGHGFNDPPPDSGLTGSQAYKREDVRLIQTLVGVTADGYYGSGTATAVGELVNPDDSPVTVVDTVVYLILTAHTHQVEDHEHQGKKTGGVIR